jgi:hypothetical protein
MTGYFGRVASIDWRIAAKKADVQLHRQAIRGAILKIKMKAGLPSQATLRRAGLRAAGSRRLVRKSRLSPSAGVVATPPTARRRHNAAVLLRLRIFIDG